MTGHVQASKKNISHLVHINTPEVPISPVFDKSTMTEESESYLDRDNKLGMLQSMFPSISVPDLEDILDKCHGDQDWAVNLLIDFGQEFNDRHCKMPTPEPKPVEDVKTRVEEVVVEKTEQKEVEKTARPPDISCDQLVLTLEPAFALQLEEMFGSVGFYVSPDSLSTEYLQVSLDKNLAHSIHTLWRKTLCDKFADPTPTTTSTTGGSVKNSPSKGIASIPSHDNHQVPSLSAIMSMEAALEAKRQEMLKSCNNNADALATKLGRLKLYSIFPGIDRAALDEMYQANNYKLSLTLLCLRETLGDGPSGGLWLNDELAQQTEQELIQMAAQESTNGQWDPDWTTWVADLPPEEMDPFPITAISNGSQPVEGYDELRAEATLHYRQRRECIQKSIDAYRRGMKAVAAFYAQQGRLHFEKLEEANQRASEKVLEIRNQSLDAHTLDLHGLYVTEAVCALRQFLERKKSELQKSPLNRLVLSVITGRGVHSSPSTGPRLRPAIHEYLQKENYRFDSSQDGLVKITLT